MRDARDRGWTRVAAKKTTSSSPYKPSKSVKRQPVLRFVQLSRSVFSDELGVAAIVPSSTVAAGEVSPFDANDEGSEQVGPLGCTGSTLTKRFG